MDSLPWEERSKVLKEMSAQRILDVVKNLQTERNDFRNGAVQLKDDLDRVTEERERLCSLARKLHTEKTDLKEKYNRAVGDLNISRQKNAALQKKLCEATGEDVKVLLSVMKGCQTDPMASSSTEKPDNLDASSDRIVIEDWPLFVVGKEKRELPCWYVNSWILVEV